MVDAQRHHPDIRPEEASSATQRWRYWLALSAIVTLGIALFLLIGLPDIAVRRFGDADDLMRLQEVRDWIAGQRWTDVTQYRVSPPTGMSMHWSRLVDVPLAAVMVALRPLLGMPQAELLACAAVPMLTYACIALLAAAITRRLFENDRLALLAAAFCMLNAGAYSVAHPLRIDHHGWQLVCALGMVLPLLGGRTPAKAAIAGATAALWMHISLEGIVFTAACGGWMGLRWLLDPERERATLPAYLGAVAAASLGLFVVAHGGALFDRTFCDAISPVHIVVFSVAALGSAASLALASRGVIARGAGLGASALLAAATYKLWAPQCGGGPFASLPPLDYQLWYMQIPEGLPVWKQSFLNAAVFNSFPLVALVGTALALRKARDARRTVLTDYAVLLLASFAIGLMLMRATALANVLAIPGALILAQTGWHRAMALSSSWQRTSAATTVVLLLNPLAPAIAAEMLIPTDWHASSHAPQPPSADGPACVRLENLHHLDALSPALFMTTPRTSEALIVATHHSSVSSGYHRDAGPMEQTIRFFIADDATAHALAIRYHPQYVVVCPGDADASLFARISPNGLAARLVAGKPPAWLTPLAVPGLRFAHVYAVTG